MSLSYIPKFGNRAPHSVDFRTGKRIRFSHNDFFPPVWWQDTRILEDEDEFSTSEFDLKDRPRLVLTPIRRYAETPTRLFLPREGFGCSVWFDLHDFNVAGSCLGGQLDGLTLFLSE
jgi:hypothetical protein